MHIRSTNYVIIHNCNLLSLKFQLQNVTVQMVATYAVTVDFIQDTTLDRRLPKNENFVLKSKGDTADIRKGITSISIVVCTYGVRMYVCTYVE